MSTELEIAREQLFSQGCTCVLVRGDVVRTSFERGVRPLLELLDGDGDWHGFSAADKVVGKATAYLYVLLGVSAVYAQVISRPAIAVFRQYGIPVQWETQVEAIANRDKTGFCPMESAVREIDDPHAALEAVRNTLRRLQGAQTGKISG